MVFVTLRRWGNSLGLVLPKEVVVSKHLRPNERVLIDVKPAKKIEDLFGSVKFSKSAQALKEELRRGWND